MGDLPSNCAAQNWKNDHNPLGFGGAGFLGKPSSAGGILQESAGDASPEPAEIAEVDRPLMCKFLRMHP